LVNKSMLPHRGKGGCPGFHYNGVCSHPGMCQKSHVCPLLSCGGKEHPFKLTHPNLSWSGHPVGQVQAPYQNQQNSSDQNSGKKSKGAKGSPSGKGQDSAGRGKGPGSHVVQAPWPVAPAQPGAGRQWY
jgi:hypothetical protein